MDTKEKPATAASTKPKHRTTPIKESLTAIPGYPNKLTLYLLEASSYWWVRYYIDGKITRASTRTDDKREAIKFAKAFYDELNLRRSQGLAIGKKSRFDAVASAMLAAQKAQVARGEITEATHTIAQYRLDKSAVPFFGKYDVADIHYDLLERYLDGLSHQTPKLTPSTISSYMKLVRQVLNYALKRQLVPYIPHFPAVSVADNPRGYFNTREYRLLWSRARALIGKTFYLCKTSEDETASYFAKGKEVGRKIRAITITEDLHELIVFMTNSYIRPTDIKNIKHKHIEIVRNDHVYLRMQLSSKKHDAPTVTMPKAVEVYERLTERNKRRGYGVAPDDYLFLPQYPKRDYALKQLQRQFDLLLWHTDLAAGAKGESRTLYSLRHTCIMYRLLYGEKMDVVTLARAARTSPDMINRFYAASLEAEQGIDMLQSRRKRRKRQDE